MKCLDCGQENKDSAKICKKCSRDLMIAPSWFPDARWHLRVLGAIYAVLIVLYYGVSYALSFLPKPYHLRQIPLEMTPWLRAGEKFIPEEQLKAPAPPSQKP